MALRSNGATNSNNNNSKWRMHVYYKDSFSFKLNYVIKIVEQTVSIEECDLNVRFYDPKYIGKT